MSQQRVLFLEPVGGIAGDMFLAAMIDLGVDLRQLEEALSGLGLPGWRLVTQRAVRHAISGTHLDVVLDEASAKGGADPGERSHPDPSHAVHEHGEHEHGEHEHGEHEHGEHEHEHEHGPRRGLAEIRGLISAAPTLSPRARERALAMFEELGRAEAKIHDVPVEAIHFHEVGAVDSIIDICGAAVALELLGNPVVYASPPPMGSGFIHAAHGRIPAPAPATLELLRGVTVRFEGRGELTTPTGAVILKVLARVESPGDLRVERVGYGVGTRQMKDRPNVLRATLGTVEVEEATLSVVEANLDDCSPQLLGGLIEVLLGAGALDAWITPVVMKKGRPGHLLAALVPESRKAAVTEVLLTESTSIGARSYPVSRLALARRFEVVETRFGKVRIKVAFRGPEVLNAHPEYEDCRLLASEQRVPIKRVWAEALAAYHRITPR